MLKMFKHIFLLSSSAFALSGCVTTTEKINRQDVTNMSVNLHAASKEAGVLQSTTVSVESSGRLNFSPIRTASKRLADRIGTPIPTAMTIDCEIGGVHTSTECDTQSCVTTEINTCLAARGTVEICGSIE